MAQKSRTELKTNKDLRYQANNTEAISSGTHRDEFEDNYDSHVNLTDDVDTDTTLAANSDTLVPSQKAVKAYVDANVGAGFNHLFTQAVNAQNNKITNLPDGADAGDSINKGQLDALETLLQDQIDEVFGGTAEVLTISAGSVTWDANVGKIAVLELTANVTTLTISNHSEDTEKIIIVKQDATGGRTLAGPTGYGTNGTQLDVNSTGNSFTVLHLYNGGSGYLVASTRNTSSGGGSGSGITDIYANTGALFTDQGSQATQGIYRVTDGSGFSQITSGYVWVEYLGSSNSNESDYKIIGAEEYNQRIIDNANSITTINDALDNRTRIDTWTPSATLDFSLAQNLDVTLTSDLDVTTFSNASERYSFIKLRVLSTGFNLTFSATGSTVVRGEPDTTGPYSVIIYFDGNRYEIDYTYIPDQASQVLAFSYKVDNGVDPTTSGDMTFQNFADQQNTTYLRFNEVNDAGNTITNILLGVKSGGEVAISERNNSNVYNRYIVASDAVNNGGGIIQIAVNAPADVFTRNFINNEDVAFWVINSQGAEPSTDTLQDVFDRGNVIDLDSGPNSSFQVDSISGNVDFVVDDQSIMAQAGSAQLDIQNNSGQLSNGSPRVTVDSTGAKVRDNTSGLEINVSASGIKATENTSPYVGNAQDDLQTKEAVQNMTYAGDQIIWQGSGDVNTNSVVIADGAITRFVCAGTSVNISDSVYLQGHTASAPEDVLTKLDGDTFYQLKGGAGWFDETGIDLDSTAGRSSNTVRATIPNINLETLTNLGWVLGYTNAASKPAINFTGAGTIPTVVESGTFIGGQTNRYILSYSEGNFNIPESPKVIITWASEATYTNVGQSVLNEIVARYDATGQALTASQISAWQTFLTTVGESTFQDEVYTFMIGGASVDFTRSHALVDARGNGNLTEVGIPTYTNNVGWDGWATGVALSDTYTMDNLPADQIALMAWTGAGTPSVGVQKYIFGNLDNGNNTFFRENTDGTISTIINNNNIQNMGAGIIEADTLYTVARNGIVLETYRDGASWQSASMADQDERQAANPLYVGGRYNQTSGDADNSFDLPIKFYAKTTATLKNNVTFVNAVKTLYAAL